MKKAAGFITLHRQILDWEWYSDTNVVRLFLHILLSANFTEGRFEGRVIKRGQLVTSLTSLSAQTSLTIRQVRVSLDKLQMTGEVTSQAFNRYRVITVVKYDEYQSVDRQNGRQMTSEVSGKRQADDKQMTSNVTSRWQQYNNNNNNINKETKEQGNNNREGSAKRFTPPTKEEIFDFCLENGLSIDVDYLYDYYSSNGWMVGKNHMKDWRATVKNWARRDQGKSKPVQGPSKRVVAQEYSQRDYSGYQDDIMASFEADMRRFKETGEID